MDELIERIAECLGQRWSQLYARLGLDYRGRFQIHTRNEKLETAELSNCQCTRDTIEAWRDSSQRGVDEIVVVSRLLGALRKIRGMEELAEELAKLFGLSLGDEFYSEFDSGSTHFVSGKRDIGVTSKEHGVIGKLKNGSNPEKEFAHMYKAQQNANLQPMLHPRDNVSPLYSPASRYSLKSSLRPHLPEASSVLVFPKEVMEQKIDPKIKDHKMALLDVSQLLHVQHFLHICTTLELPEEDIQEIIAEEILAEELYYRMFQLWLAREDEDQTFAKLVSVLLKCEEESAVERLRIRLTMSI